ncbi:MAG: amidohydrolase family protein [Acidimicrobiales bacterium]
MASLSVIDSHTHPMVDLRQQVLADPHPPTDYLAKVNGTGIERAAALVMAPRADLELTRALNDAVLALSHDHGGFFFPVCSVHPADGDQALAELERVAGAGARWLKLHPNTQDFDVADPAVVPVVRKAAELQLPVLFDAYSPWDPAQPGKFVKLAIEVPEAKLILAHAHGPSFAALLVYEVLARYPWWRRQVWIDISATASLLAAGPYVEQFVWVLRKVGMDRILFGSDYPLDNPRTALANVLQLGFSDAELQLVLHDNTAALLDGGIAAAKPPARASPESTPHRRSSPADTYPGA